MDKGEAARPGILSELQAYLDTADLVLLIDVNDAGSLTERLCRSTALSDTKKRVVVLGTANFPCRPGQHRYRTLSGEEMRALLELYRMYEASDWLRLLSRRQNYGNLWNYVRNGIITEEELFAAVIG